MAPARIYSVWMDSLVGREAPPFGAGMAKSLVVKGGDAAGDVGEHLCGRGLVGAAGGNELQPRKERDLGGSGRLRFLSNCRFGFWENQIYASLRQFC